MDSVEYFEIGKIVNTQGLHGDLRILPVTDEPKRFLDLKEVIVDNGKSKSIYKIERVWFHKNFVIIKFYEISDMTSAEKLKGTSIKIDRKEALPLNKDEYYISDLYDMDVYTDENEYLGKIDDIIFTASNDVYQVKCDGKNILLPAIKQCILNVDLNSRKMTVHLMEGLRE